MLKNLQNPNAFHDDIPQNICNSLWGLGKYYQRGHRPRPPAPSFDPPLTLSLGKLEAYWAHLPNNLLQDALLRCVRSVTAQELSNSIYGIAILDADWQSVQVCPLLPVPGGRP